MVRLYTAATPPEEDFTTVTGAGFWLVLACALPKECATDGTRHLLFIAMLCIGNGPRALAAAKVGTAARDKEGGIEFATVIAGIHDRLTLIPAALPMVLMPRTARFRAMPGRSQGTDGLQTCGRHASHFGMLLGMLRRRETDKILKGVVERIVVFMVDKIARRDWPVHGLPEIAVIYGFAAAPGRVKVDAERPSWGIKESGIENAVEFQDFTSLHDITLSPQTRESRAIKPWPCTKTGWSAVP